MPGAHRGTFLQSPSSLQPFCRHLSEQEAPSEEAPAPFVPSQASPLSPGPASSHCPSWMFWLLLPSPDSCFYVSWSLHTPGAPVASSSIWQTPIPWAKPHSKCPLPIGSPGLPSLGTAILLQPGVTHTGTLGRGQQAIPGRRRGGALERADAGRGRGRGTGCAPGPASSSVRRYPPASKLRPEGPDASAPHWRTRPGRGSVLPREGSPAPCWCERGPTRTHRGGVTGGRRGLGRRRAVGGGRGARCTVT